MDKSEPEVHHCGREQQLFAMNLLLNLSNESMARLKHQFEEKEIHIQDVWFFITLSLLYILSRFKLQFVELMEEHVQQSYFDEKFITDLVNLFEEIDVNGDGGMEWEVWILSIIVIYWYMFGLGIYVFYYWINSCNPINKYRQENSLQIIK